MSEYQHIWSIFVADVCHREPRELRYVAPATFDAALAIGKDLIIKKWPNPFKDKWPECEWHPDKELVGIKRGEELDNDEAEV